MKKIKEFFVKVKKFVVTHIDDILPFFGFVLAILLCVFLFSSTFNDNNNNNNNLDTVSVCSYNNDYTLFNNVSASERDVVTYSPAFDYIPLSNLSFYYDYYFYPVSAVMLGVDYSVDNLVIKYPTIVDFNTDAISFNSIKIVKGLNEFYVACTSPSSNVDVVNFRVQFYFNYDPSESAISNQFSLIDSYSYSFEVVPFDSSFPSDYIGKFASLNSFDFGNIDIVMYCTNYPSDTQPNVSILNQFINVEHFIGYYDNYNIGYDAGLSDGIVNRGLFGFLGDSVFNIFSIELFPNFPIYNLLLIGVGLLTFGLLVKLFNW